MKKSYFLSGMLLLSTTVFAQDKIKDGTVSGSGNVPKDGALLDLESNNRALLLTRVSLSATTTWGLNGTPPSEGGYTVYNTNSTISGASGYPVISGGIGVYYWDGTGWVATRYNATYVEPWNVQGTTTSATLNTQNIYQSGTVAIGRNEVYTGATLHVEGAIRGGTNPQGTVGVNSIALGYENEASGGSSFAVGYQVKATGLRSVALGEAAVASGSNATAFGHGSEARGSRGTAFGYNTVVGANAANGTAFGNSTLANGNNSTAFGLSTEARGLRGTAFGYGSITGVDALDATAFGISTLASGNASTSFGANTIASGDRATAFGNTTIANGPSSTAFGYLARATEMRSTAFGYDTRANGNTSTAFGGETIANGLYGTSFGYQTRANGATSTAFGSGSIANGDRSTAFGSGATTGADATNSISMGTSTSVSHSNSLVAGNNVASSADNQFTARFQGGFRFMTQAQSTGNVGAQLLNSANAWSTMSSKLLKENFQPVDAKQVLAKITNFELTSWNYKGQDKTKLRHYGPMAEDFYEAFGNDGIGTIGVDDSINQADFDGINMIAIQALANENIELKGVVEKLNARIEKLEKLILEKK